MEKNYFLLSCLSFCLVFSSCEKEEEVETYEVAVPVTMSVADFRASVKITPPQEISESGKIYVYENYIFVNDMNRGILVIDNSNYTPEKVQFLEIPQNTDIAIKNNMLFANSGMDLVTFDISDIHNIQMKERLENVFDFVYPAMPVEASYIDLEGFDHSREVVVGYTLESRPFEEAGGGFLLSPALENFSGDRSGTGGSMARFNIGGDYLYAAGTSKLDVFDISNLAAPQKVSTDYAGWQIETIFNHDGYLYLGSATGMFIYSIEDPANPVFMSGISHVVGCDPVVVSGDLAYVTIRGGDECGQNFNQLEVIDVSDKSSPQLLEVYQMDGPYGLGVRDNKLFVCDGDSGLKIYDASMSPELELTDHYEDLNAFDVIPMEDVLILIGDDVLRQYSYKNNQINLISTFNLN